MSEEIKLLPCPFCGAEAITSITKAGYTLQHKDGCALRYEIPQGVQWFVSDFAITSWNTRVSTSEQAAKMVNTPSLAPQPPVEQLKKDISNAAKIGLLTGALEGLLHYRAPINGYDYGEMKKRIKEILEQSKTYGD